MAFNTIEYAWKDIQIVIAGRLVTGVREISYETERVVTHIYASGDDPHSRTKGNKTYKGEIKLLQSEIEALQELCKPGQDLTDLTFDITVAYAQDLTSRIKTDVLENVDVTKIGKGMKQGDSNMEVSLSIMIGKIKYNV